MKRVKYKMGKLGKYVFMNKHKQVSSYLPDTRAANKSNMNTMLNRYGTLFLKPDTGTGGHGICKISKHGGTYTLKSGNRSRRFTSFQALYGSIHHLLRKDRYVIQKGIDLLKHKERPFDIRVMVQKNKSKNLIVTGIVGRLAKRGKIVTNYHSGGTPLPVELLLGSHLNGAKKTNYIHRIKQLGKVASVVLGKSYRRKRAFGVDIAIDKAMKPWVLEVNTKPDMTIFNELKNKTMYRRVLRYARIKG